MHYSALNEASKMFLDPQADKDKLFQVAREMVKNLYSSKSNAKKLSSL